MKYGSCCSWAFQESRDEIGIWFASQKGTISFFLKIVRTTYSFTVPKDLVIVVFFSNFSPLFDIVITVDLLFSSVFECSFPPFSKQVKNKKFLVSLIWIYHVTVRARVDVYALILRTYLGISCSILIRALNVRVRSNYTN